MQQAAVNMANDVNESPPSEALKHSSTCASVFPRSVFDKTCPRCNIISKVVSLNRKSTANGASMDEELAARVVATRLATKAALKPVELVDRLYQTQVRTTERIKRKSSRRTVMSKVGATTW